MNKKTVFINMAALAAFTLLASACAGPTTPLGAIWSLTPEAANQKKILTNALKTQAFDDTASKTSPETLPPPLPTGPAQAVATLRPTPQATELPKASKTEVARAYAAERALHPHISFWPKHLILHGRTPLRIAVEDPTTSSLHGYRLIVRYNGEDVTSTFLLRATVEQKDETRKLMIENPSIRLSAAKDHDIEVFYLSPSGAVSYARYENPKCYAFRPLEVHTIGEFEYDQEVMRTIERISTKGGLSPSFFTALVAQESGFNTNVVSWARALGLTQITSSAEGDFIDKYSGWPRYQGVNDIPVPVLKALILAGRMNPRNEWRLDPEKSIQGGVDYAILLAERWSTPERLARIRATFAEDPEEAHTELVLASYHSGYNRVLTAFDRLGKLWLYSPDLREARKYVHKIESYCDYFSTQGDTAPEPGQRAGIWRPEDPPDET
jgi:hypothetical protein